MQETEMFRLKKFMTFELSTGTSLVILWNLAWAVLWAWLLYPNESEEPTLLPFIPFILVVLFACDIGKALWYNARLCLYKLLNPNERLPPTSNEANTLRKIRNLNCSIGVLFVAVSMGMISDYIFDRFDKNQDAPSIEDIFFIGAGGVLHLYFALVIWSYYPKVIMSYRFYKNHRLHHKFQNWYTL